MQSKTNMLCIMIIAGFFSRFCYCSAESDSLSKLKDVLNNHEHNFKSIFTFRAEVKAMKEKIYDVGTVKYWNREIIWFDRGSVCRKVTDGNYYGNSPEGLVLEVDDRGGRYQARRSPVNSMSIFTKESEAWYDGSTRAVVNHTESKKIARDSNYLLRYQSVFGKSLKEMLLKCYEEGKVTIQSESLDGEDCLKLRWEFPNHGGGSAWLVPSKGHCIKKLQTEFDGKIYNEYSTTLMEYKPGFWWFKDVTVKEDWGGGKLVTKEKIEVESVEFNQPIDPAVFTLKSLPPGTVINDRISGIKYVVSDGRYALDALDSAFESLQTNMDVNSVVGENDGTDEAESKVHEVNTADGVMGRSAEKGEENKPTRYSVMIVGSILVVLIMAGLIGWRKIRHGK